MPALLRFINGNWLPITLLILVAITTLSLMPLPALPSSVPGTDKTHHFIAYGLLMFPVALHNPRHWLLIGLFFVSWSGAIELLQPYVNRHAEWMDMLSNVGGLLCGTVIARLCRRWSHHWARPLPLQ